MSKYPLWDAEIAVAIIFAESGGRTDVVNWKDNHVGCLGSKGLWQLACFWGTDEELKDPVRATEIAYEIYSTQGWRPWGAFSNGSFRKFLY